jgi:hypothetical protein
VAVRTTNPIDKRRRILSFEAIRWPRALSPPSSW